MKDKKTLQTLAIINVAIFSVIALILLTDASLRALVAEYTIPAIVVVAVAALLVKTLRNSEGDDEDENTGMALSPIKNEFGFFFHDEN